MSSIGYRPESKAGDNSFCFSDPLILSFRFAAILCVALSVICSPVYAQETADWSGVWDTKWRDGGAQLKLEQDGAEVRGEYPLYGGRIEARASGNQLIGKWIEQGREGEFIFMQSPDGQSFMGRFETQSSEWWTGVHIDAELYQSGPIDRSTPMATMRSFLKLMNDSGADHLERAAGAAVDMTGHAATLLLVAEEDRQGANLINYTRLYFDVINHLTFRLWSLPQKLIGDQTTVTLDQFGTRVDFDLNFRRIDGEWLIVGPPLSAVKAKLTEFVEARDEQTDMVNDPRNLRTPRDTFMIFLWGLHNFSADGDNPAYKTLNVSEMSTAVRADEAPLLSRYLKEVLDRVGYVYWQEIPDDPASTEPYVHLEHPAGDVVVGPVETEDGIIWQFTPETLRNIRTLYANIEELPLAPELGGFAGRDLFFKTRAFAKSISPESLTQLGPMERWQWILLALACLLAVAFAFLGRAVLSRFVRWIRLRLFGDEGPAVGPVLVWSMRSIFFGLFMVVALNSLGLPHLVATPVKAIVWLAIVIAAVPVAWYLINAVADQQRRSWVLPGYHETLVSLISGVARVAVIVTAILLLAEVLGLPYQGVLAGLGIGGLAVALAAQPTLQNFLSGLTLYADRPVSVGDFCRFGDNMGTVEHIGMRSTQVRSPDRTVISIPNAEFSNMQLENFTRRDHIRFRTLLQLRYETSMDQLQYVLAELRKLLLAHPRVTNDPCRVRFVGFGEFSLDIEVFAYILTADHDEFLAIREDIFLRIIRLMDEAGAQFAFPSAVEYQATDTPIDLEKRAAAEEKVKAWRAEEKMPFPDFDQETRAVIANTLPYPPEGSVAKKIQTEVHTVPLPKEAHRKSRRWMSSWWNSVGS